MIPLRKSLSDLKVVDLGLGMGAGVVAKFLADLGARVTRFEPVAGDPFYQVYPAYSVWHGGASIEKVPSANAAAIHQALLAADVCVMGGEDWPGFAWRPDLAEIRERNPKLVVLDIQGYPDGLPAAGRPSAEILVQARSGVAFEQFSDRPLYFGFSGANLGAALHGTIGLLGALYARERGGRNLEVKTSLYEGMLTWAVHAWFTATKPSGSFKFLMPKDPHPLIFKCKDGKYIHFVLGSFGSKGRIYRILQIDDPTVDPDDSGRVTGLGEPKNFFGDVDVLAAHVINFDSDYLVDAIQASGVAVEHVLAPGECWDDPQTQHNQVIATESDGSRHLGLPMRGELIEGKSGAGVPSGGTPNKGPLSGVRILDFGLFVAGPFSGVPLAALGADVIKVEPLDGDPNRTIYRSFASVNRGKRSIAVDMKTPEGSEIIRRLGASATILQNNFRPGVSKRLGVDPETVLGRDPGKIVLESTGYGRSGPKGDRPGFDMVFQAFCGLEIRAGGTGNPPLWNRSSMVDYVQGGLNAIVMLASLYHRIRTGGGADVQTSLLDAGLFLLSDLVQGADGSFQGAPPLNHERTGIHPAESFYQAKDGWIAIAARTDEMAQALARVLDIAELQGKARAAWDDKDAAAITASVGRNNAEALLRALDEAGVWAEHCETRGDRILEERPPVPTLVAEVEHPLYGLMRQVGVLFRLHGVESGGTSRLPGIGEHSREILAELGYDVAQIDDFYTRKIVTGGA